MSEYRFFSHSSLSILFDRFHCQVFMFSFPIKCKYSFVKVNGSKKDQRNAWWVLCASFSALVCLYTCVLVFFLLAPLACKFITHNNNLHIEKCVHELLVDDTI